MGKEVNDQERYRAAAHAMQTGVAYAMEQEPNGETTPKHLRVGVNDAMADQEGLVTLLLSKGIITEKEYFKAVADSMERERDRYQKRLNEYYGGSTNITLA
jgi:hypothetical protein